MRGPVRGVIFGLLFCTWALTAALAPPALAQTPTTPQQPFSQLVDVWTRQLDRISDQAGQTDLLAAEIDTLREQATEVRTAAAAAAQIARGELADTKRLLAPLEPRTGPDGKPLADQPPETDAVKAERQRLTDQASISESQLKQCEVVIVRADQLLERMTQLRGQVVIEQLLHRGISPLSPQTWSQLGGELSSAVQTLSEAMTKWRREGLAALQSGEQDLTPLLWWALLTIVVWWVGRTLRHRYGRSEATEPGQRDRTIAAAIDGLDLVLAPILAVWLIGRLLAASRPPAPIDVLLPEFIARAITLLLVLGLTATFMAPSRPGWRVLPLSNDSARKLSRAMRRLMSIGIVIGFVESALTQGLHHDAVEAVGALLISTVVGLLTLPTLTNRAWQAARPEGSDLPAVVGGTWWSIARMALTVVVLLPIAFAALGYSTLGEHVHSSTANTCLLLALALAAHRLAADLLQAAAAPDTQTGRWVRSRFGFDADAPLRGQHIAILLIDLVLVVAFAILVPAVWGADINAILRTLEQLMHGVHIGGVRISIGDIATAILMFVIALFLARVVRAVVRDRVMPTVDAPLPLRQSIDAGLNYAGVIIAILVGVAALGIDFTNLAIVLGALSVGIGLGLQNIANNVISGVILLVERPIKSGDWVSVSGHEGFVRRINIRATEIETFQRTHVIVPNSVFLQNPVINRTYADTSSRVDIQLTVGLGTDVAKLEGILRELALGHPRVLRVPQPIVRFVRLTPTGLEFELFVFVGQLEDRTVVQNELNAAILGRLIDEKIVDPAAAPRYRVQLEHQKPPPTHAEPEERKDDAAPPTR